MLSYIMNFSSCGIMPGFGKSSHIYPPQKCTDRTSLHHAHIRVPLNCSWFVPVPDVVADGDELGVLVS